MVPLVAVLGGVVVVRDMTERVSLMASENPGGDERSGRTGLTSAGGIENIGAVNDFNAGHGGHSLGGRGHGGGYGAGGGRATYFSGPFCQLLSGVGPSKSYWGHRIGAR